LTDIKENSKKIVNLVGKAPSSIKHVIEDMFEEKEEVTQEGMCFISLLPFLDVVLLFIWKVMNLITLFLLSWNKIVYMIDH
jgi:hypothetical protein